MTFLTFILLCVLSASLVGNVRARRRARLALPEKTADALRGSPQIETWCQPVFLLGPRDVGKTSLIRQWLVGAQEGWTQVESGPSHQSETREIPIHDLQLAALQPHYAFPEFEAPIEVHLKLRVYDFPGDLGKLAEFLDAVVRESSAFTRDTKRDTEQGLGVVLVCLFNAAELCTGVTPDTREYYESPPFKQLHRTVVREEARVERLVVVFNRIDLLKDAYPHLSYADLREECRRFFRPYYRELIEQCELPADRVHFEVTMLSPEALVAGNLNAPRVLGHCARSIVAYFRGVRAEGE